MLKKVKNYLHIKVYLPLLGFLKEGTSPNKLAQSVAFGFIFGIFPILGTTTIICVAIALVLRLNHAAIQLVNYVVYPIQLTLLIPIVQLGLYISGINISPEKFEGTIYLLAEEPWEALSDVGNILLSGVLGWFMVAVPVYIIIYFLCLKLFQKVS